MPACRDQQHTHQSTELQTAGLGPAPGRGLRRPRHVQWWPRRSTYYCTCSREGQQGHGSRGGNITIEGRGRNWPTNASDSVSYLSVQTQSHLAMEGAYSILVLTSKTGQSSTAATALDIPR